MTAPLPAIETSAIERDIIKQIAAAKIGLRSDKSVLRLVNGLKVALAEAAPEGQTIVFTVTAPIRRRAKTAAALESLVLAGLAIGKVVRDTIHDNQVRLRRLTRVLPCMPKVIGFVHNCETDAELILALARSRLLARDWDYLGKQACRTPALRSRLLRSAGMPTALPIAGRTCAALPIVNFSLFLFMRLSSFAAASASHNARW